MDVFLLPVRKLLFLNFRLFSTYFLTLDLCFSGRPCEIMPVNLSVTTFSQELVIDSSLNVVEYFRSVD